MGEHRVSVLGSLRRYEDPARSSDPAIRRIVSDLRTLEIAPEPRAHFRAELRSQLVAVAPRLIAEGVGVEHAVATQATVAREAAQSAESPSTARARIAAVAERLSGLSLAKPFAVVTAVVAVFAMLLGGAVWISTKSLPGDALYSLKRANEDVKLSLTSGGTARGKQYLDLAATRADEVSDLLGRSSALAAGAGPVAGAGISPRTAALVTTTLGSADDDVRNAATLLGQESVNDRSAAPLAVMTSWAPGQLQRLQTITSRIPAGALHDRAAASAALVAAADQRATALQHLVGCSCLSGASTDQLGPVPCTVCSAPAPGVPAPIVPSTPRGGATTTAPNPARTRGTTAVGGSSGSAGSTAGPTGPSGGVVLPPVVGPSGGGTSSAPVSGGISLPVTISVPPILPAPTPTTSSSTSTSTQSTTTAPCVVNLLGVCVKI